MSNEIDRVTAERLAELIVWLDRKYSRHHEEEDREAAAALRAFQRLRSTPDAGRCERDARIADLERRLAEAERDAERYRWLRGQYRLMSPHMDGQHHWAPKMAAFLKGSSVDAAIDAAMGKETK